MKILHIGKYADPELVGSNRLLSEQVFGLRDRGYEVEVLTWPGGDGWTRQEAGPHTGQRAGHAYLGLDINGVPYHVIGPPRAWGLRWITDGERCAAVDYAKRLLRELVPAAIHFHYWHCLWWFLDAAVELGIPTLYTAYDYGLSCAQTTLVMGDRSLCDATATVKKCAACTRLHPSLKGSLNELLLDLPGGGAVIRALTGPNGIAPLRKVNAMRMSARERAAHAIERSRRILPKLSGMIVTTPFAGRFFAQFGVAEERFDCLPWFYSQVSLNDGPAKYDEGKEIVLAYVGRLSREKGVHLLLEALEQVDTPQPVRLKLTGIPRSDYAKELHQRFPKCAGACRLEWAGWVDNQKIPEFYADVHATVFPSTWYDNCPTTLIEALAHRKFILCSDVPTMAGFVVPETNAILFKREDVGDLADSLQRFLAAPAKYLECARNFDSGVRSREGYLDELERIYAKRFFLA